MDEMYVLLHPSIMSEIVESHSELLERYVRQEEHADVVLQDLLNERAAWSGEKWVKARSKHNEHPELNLFCMGNGRLRQSIFKRRQVRYSLYGVEIDVRGGHENFQPTWLEGGTCRRQDAGSLTQGPPERSRKKHRRGTV